MHPGEIKGDRATRSPIKHASHYVAEADSRRHVDLTLRPQRDLVVAQPLELNGQDILALGTPHEDRVTRV
jgi:hypothetical protein